MVIRVVGSNEDPGLQWFAHILSEKLSYGQSLRLDPSEELIGHPASGDRVVLSSSRGGEARGLPLHHRPHAVALDGLGLEVGGLEAGVEGGEAGLVPHELGHGGALLAVLAKLGPVLGDLVVVAEQALVHQHSHADCSETLHRDHANVESLWSSLLIYSMVNYSYVLNYSLHTIIHYSLSIYWKSKSSAPPLCC